MCWFSSAGDPARPEATAPHVAAAELIVADVVDSGTPALVAGRLAGHEPERVVLVSAAGLFGPVDSLETTDMDDWARTREVHVVGAAAMTKTVLPWMRGSGGAGSSTCPRPNHFAGSTVRRVGMRPPRQRKAF